MLLRSGETFHEERMTKSLLELLHAIRFVLKLLYSHSWFQNYGEALKNSGLSTERSE